jgi:prepilin-type N-terminal cleavage/methylation domain-containing protein
MKSHGFTLVEISLVMIIIGLLIGGIFGGMAMIENMQVNSTIQFMKNVESAAIKFNDAYGTLPGDLRDPSVVLPGCTSVPCSVTSAQNGDRKLVSLDDWSAAINLTNERFVFWHQLSAAGMITGIPNMNSLVFGEGQPNSPLDTGARIVYFSNMSLLRHGIALTNVPSIGFGGITADDLIIKGTIAKRLDDKLDDGVTTVGRLRSWNVSPVNSTAAAYDINSNYGIRYLYNF